MSSPTGADPAVGPSGPSGATGLADGEWHRLHPATPLLRGGIAFLAIIGIIVANLRERLLEFLIPGIDCPDGDCGEPDPLRYVTENGYVLLVLAGILALIVVLLAIFWVSWRMHTFRVTGEVVEVRSGVLFRTHRQARLDRIQEVDLARPFLARLFGAAKLEIGVAGQDANVSLQYLSGTQADALRAEILRLASGVQSAPQATSSGPAGGSLLDRRLSELVAPELDPGLAAPESVVHMHPGRLVASTLLSSTTVVMVIVVAALVVLVTVSPESFYVLFFLIPTLLGLASYFANRLLKFLRYSIAATPDGVRIGYGLLSTRNDTLPPGRIHSVSVSQNLLWRPADWWTVTVNRASRSTSQSGGAQQNTVVLPVGTRADAMRVLELMLPELLGPDAPAAPAAELRELLEPGLAGHGGPVFTTSPRRAAVLRWFSWRRNGFALFPGLILLRRGAIWRELVLVPAPRIQSVSVEQGPIERSLDLAGVHLHTVAGPISARLGALDRGDAEGFFRDAATVVISAAAADRSHRWRSGEALA